MPFIRCGMFALALIVMICEVPHAQDRPSMPVWRIGIVVDGPWERNDEIQAMFEREILDLTSGEFDVRFPADRRLIADWSPSGVRSAIDSLLNDPDVDMLLTLGVIGSNDVARRTLIPKPVVGPFVLDPTLQDLPLQNGTSGVHNLNYVALPANLESNLKRFRDIVPYTRVIILLPHYLMDIMPDMHNRMRTTIRDFDAELQVLPVRQSVEEIFEGLPPDAEAVYVTPLLHLPSEDHDRLVSGLIERRLPSFSLLGRYEVERGLLATQNIDFFPRVTRRVALNMQQIMLGDDPSTIPVSFTVSEQLVINMDTARAIGLRLNWAVRTEAEFINQIRNRVDRRLTLNGVVQEAMRTNLFLTAQDHAVDAGAEEIRKARATLLPQFNVATQAVFIDEDRAQASFGSQAQRSANASATVDQLIFSEPAWANMTIQRRLQTGRSNEREQLRLDIARDAATAYLNVLRVKTFEQIQRENVKRSRSNLGLARVRQSVGVSGPEDVYRWESTIATNRKDVIQANAQRNQAEIALNRILHRPLEEPFLTQETTLDDPGLLTAQGGLLVYMSDQLAFRVLRDFMVQEGIAVSPELQRLDAAIAVQRRLYSSTRRAFIAPTIGLRASIANTYWRAGAGSGGSGLQLPAGSGTLLQADDTNWSLGINFSFPLYTGSSRIAARAQAREELTRIRVERDAIAEQIEQRIRSAMHQMGASYAGIQQARLAAVAADNNLQLVTDAYSQGAVNIIQLIDAQNAGLVAAQAAASAVYDFLIDLMAAERAIGQFSLLKTPEERNAFFQRLDAYFTTTGIEVR